MKAQHTNVDYLRQQFDYCNDTGIFTHKHTKSSNAKAGMPAGHLHKDGYVYLWIDGKSQAAHRVAWLFQHGVFPPNLIDHINGNRSDNRLINLREATKSQNAENQSAYRNGKLIGASFHKRNKKWSARIIVRGKNLHLGYFPSEIEAHKAYVQAKLLAHNFSNRIKLGLI